MDETQKDYFLKLESIIETSAFLFTRFKDPDDRYVLYTIAEGACQLMNKIEDQRRGQDADSD